MHVTFAARCAVVIGMVGDGKGAREVLRLACVPACFHRYDQDTTPTPLRYFAYRNGSAVPMQFTIDTLSGVLSTLTTLDFEATPWDAFLVTVSDLGLNVTVPVNVTVVDRNDPPVFVCNDTAAPACYVFRWVGLGCLGRHPCS